MQVEIFSLCDAATDNFGKLNILGAFDTINSSRLPFKHPHFSIATRIRFNSVEKGEHHVTVNFVDIDGKPFIQPTKGMLKIDFPPDRRTRSANLILNVQQIEFKQAGEYSIDLLVDGNNMAAIPLYIVTRQFKPEN